MRVYLAARYSRRLELCEYRERIDSIEGFQVKSRWLNGEHQISDQGVPIGEKGESLVECPEGDNGSLDPRACALRAKFAEDDVDDVLESDVLIAFTEPPRSNSSRGGRHVELGIAIGSGKLVCVVGHRENIFCWHEYVHFAPTFEDALEWLASLSQPIAAASI